MGIITREQVKTQLGITVSSSDADIDAKLPIINAKVKAITRRNWNDRIVGNITTGSKYIEVHSYGSSGYDQYYDDLADYILPGQQITGTGIPTGAYIQDIYPKGTATSDVYPQIEIDQNATATTNGEDLFLGFPITYHDIVAKGVWYLIGRTSTTIDDSTWASKNVGPLSVTRSEMAARIEGVGGMPAWFNQALPRYH